MKNCFIKVFYDILKQRRIFFIFSEVLVRAELTGKAWLPSQMLNFTTRFPDSPDRSLAPLSVACGQYGKVRDANPPLYLERVTPHHQGR